MNKIVSDVNAEISKVESKLDKQNAAWLKSGGEKVFSGGDEGKGTQGFTAERKSEAAKIIAGIKKGK